jgi:hypothetical protein
MLSTPNNSASGGFLFPGPGVFSYSFSLATDPRYWRDSVPPDGQPLENFLQQMVAGITGIPEDLVRPRWQPEEPALPDYGTDWIAVGVTTSEPDPGWPWEWYDPGAPDLPVTEDGDPEGLFTQSHEVFELLCTCYGEHADWYDGLIRDGFRITQNNALLLLSGMALNRVTGRVFAPEFLQGRWWRRADRRVLIHRNIRRLYPILNLLSGHGIIATD